MNKLIKEKIQQSVSILQEKEIDMWLTFVRESSYIHDPVLDIIAGTNATWESAFIICRDGSYYCIVGSLEVANQKLHGVYENIIGYVKSVKEPLVELISSKKPESIAINYSQSANLADGLTHGLFLNLMNYLKGTGYEDKLVSSEEIIAALRGRKSSEEISYMKEAVKITLDIYDQVTGFMKPGKTEKDVADFIKGKVKEKGLEFAWDEEHCPAVFTGPGTAGAHAGPTGREIKKGHILNIDFGVKYKGYCSDLQRTWYFLQDGETKAPEEVQKGFDTIVTSIQKAKDELKPGMMGCEIDDVARNYIVNKGYEEYPHGLGHQVGKVAHDGGCGLFPRWERYGNTPFLKIEENQVYTIEPRLTVEGYGIATVEEEVLVTKNGCEYLSNPQKELFLIKS